MSSLRYPATLFLFVLLCSLSQSVGQAQPKTPRLLILNEVGTTYPGINLIDQGIRDSVDISPDKLETYREYMETTLFPSPADQQRFRNFYIRKYQNRRPDVIITVGPTPLRFMLEVHDRDFAGIPTVFCIPNWEWSITPKLTSDFTGAESDVEAFETVQTALRLQPSTRNIVVVGGTSVPDTSYVPVVKEQLRFFEGKLQVSYLTGLTMPDLLERLKNLPKHTIVLFASFSRDAAGTNFTSGGASARVAAAANAPVFSLSDSDFGHGEVGGKVTSLREQGRIAGGIARRILNGEKVQEIPRVKAGAIYMFDWRAIERWRLNEKNIPAGSIVLNKSRSFWEMYKWYVLTAALVLLAQAAAILGLLRQRARRRKSEGELRLSEEKFSKCFRHSPLVITISRISDARYLEVNDAFEEQSGWKREEVIGRTPFDLNLWENPDTRIGIIAQLVAKGTVRDVEFKVRRKDGRILTALGSAELIEVNGEPCSLSVAADITERKAAEEALAGVSRKLVEAQEAERTRIARELHDDINQRLAMLAVNLKLLKQELPSSEVKTGRRIQEACNKVAGLENDIQALSHRLHSSGLEYLGLEAAVTGFCRELSERQNLQIHARFEDVPEMLPHEVSLCLFLVLQEAVHNAVKYSGVSEFEVSLAATSNEVELAVHDSGVGFDPSKASSNGRGLGLTSMRERLRLVNGQLSIESKPQHGTTVLARVPLDTSHTSEQHVTSEGAVA